MPRKSIGERPMTAAERQARCRAARAAGAPVVRTRRPADHRSRPDDGTTTSPWPFGSSDVVSGLRSRMTFPAQP